MENIWYVLGFNIFLIIVFVVLGIIFKLKKEKNYYLERIIIFLCFVFLLVVSFPYVKDIVDQETTEFTAVYVEYRKDNIEPQAWRLVFKSDNKTYEIISPIITKIHVKLEPGKTYKIEYYNNTKVIKSYTLTN